MRWIASYISAYGGRVYKYPKFVEILMAPVLVGHVEGMPNSARWQAEQVSGPRSLKGAYCPISA